MELDRGLKVMCVPYWLNAHFLYALFSLNDGFVWAILRILKYRNMQEAGRYQVIRKESIPHKYNL